jgi:hypothetical protein
MRLLLILVLAGAGYLGYNYYNDHKEEVDQRINTLLGRESAPATGAASDTPTSPGEAAPPAPPVPTFTSKIGGDAAPTGEKKLAPPGIFYVVKRQSVMTANGVKAVSPGEKVTLLQRLGGGKMKVTTGDADFELEEKSVTNDLDVAREAEKQEFVARGGKL